MGDYTTSEDQADCLETQFSEVPLTELFACRLALRVRQGGTEEMGMDGVEQGSDEGRMVGDLCEELPEHIMDHILSKLSALSFLRLRCVCKRWNTLISDPLFLENCSRARPTGSDALPLFVFYPDRARQNYPTYDPILNKWYLLPQTVNTSSPGGPSSSLFIVAAAGGLLCLTDGDFSSGTGMDLYVSNPITKAWRRLPPTIRMSKSYVVQMVINSVKNTYKILVILPKEDIQVYDSECNSWQMIGGVLNRHRHAMRVGTTSCQGILYGLTGGSSTSIAAYHIDRGIWEDVRAPLPAYLTSPQLFVSRGQLMLVGAVPLNGIIQTVCVWQLASHQMEWVEVLRVPNNLFSGLSKGGRLGFYNFFAPSGDFVCFAHFRVNQLLMCNIVEKNWWWLPFCPVDASMDDTNMSRFPRNLSWFPIYPSLVASA